MPDASNASEWFVVHPAFDQPRPAADFWLGVTESDIRDWLAGLEEEAQEAALRASWQRAGDWAVQRGADCVVVDVENEFVEQLVDVRFAIDPHSRLMIFTGDRTAMTSALACVAEVRRANVLVCRGDVELLHVRDMSWDSVFVRLGFED